MSSGYAELSLARRHELSDRMREVLCRAVGTTTVIAEDPHRPSIGFLVYRATCEGTSVPQLTLHRRYSATGTGWHMSGPRNDRSDARWAIRVRPPGVLPAAALWARRDLSERQRNTALAEVFCRWWMPYPGTPDPSWNGAQEAFAFRGHIPVHEDGRHGTTAVAEPYPGCWTMSDVRAVQRGDLSTVWPFLE